MFVLKASLGFLLFFIVFGFLGVLLDILTEGRYAIRENLFAGRNVAMSRVKRWGRFIGRTWLMTPVFYILVVLSPFAFLFALGVYVYDCYSQTQVTYGQDGTRTVIRGVAWTKADTAWTTGIRSWLRFPRGAGDQENLKLLENYPDGTTALHALSRSEIEKRQAHGWIKIVVNGTAYTCPPANWAGFPDDPVDLAGDIEGTPGSGPSPPPDAEPEGRPTGTSPTGTGLFGRFGARGPNAPPSRGVLPPVPGTFNSE